MKGSLLFLRIAWLGLVVLVNSNTQAQEGQTVKPKENNSQGIEQDRQPEKAPLDDLGSQLTQLIGAKNTILVVKAHDQDATLKPQSTSFFTFTADHIKAVTGTSVTLKKGTPFAMTLGDPTSEDVVDNMVRKMREYGQEGWSGITMFSVSGKIIEMLVGVTTREKILKVAALVKSTLYGKTAVVKIGSPRTCPQGRVTEDTVLGPSWMARGFGSQIDLAAGLETSNRASISPK